MFRKAKNNAMLYVKFNEGGIEILWYCKMTYENDIAVELKAWQLKMNRKPSFIDRLSKKSTGKNEQHYPGKSASHYYANH